MKFLSDNSLYHFNKLSKMIMTSQKNRLAMEKTYKKGELNLTNYSLFSFAQIAKSNITKWVLNLNKYSLKLQLELQRSTELATKYIMCTNLRSPLEEVLLKPGVSDQNLRKNAKK